MTTQNRSVTRARDAQMIAGIKKNMQNVSTLPVAGEATTPTSLTALLQSRIDAANTVDAARARWLDAVKAYDEVDTKATAAAHALKQYALNAYGETSPVLADFGFTPHKQATLTPQQKAAAVAKRAATRKARHTMGKKAKQAVKGDVTGVVVTPVTSNPPVTPTPSGPVTPASPAPIAPANGASASAPPAPRTA